MRRCERDERGWRRSRLTRGARRALGSASARLPPPPARKVWDLKRRKQTRAFGDHAAAVRGLTFSQDDRHLVSCAADGRVLLHKLKSQRLVCALERWCYAASTPCFPAPERPYSNR